MKPAGIIIATILALTGLLHADPVPTITFKDLTADFDLFQPGESRGTGKYVVLGNQATIPTEIYLVEFDHNQAVPQITWEISERQLLTVVNPEEVFADIPTADDAAGYPAALNYRRNQNLAAVPVLTAGTTRSRGKVYLRLCLFPVTIDESGHCYFNQSITIYCDSMPLTPSQLIAENDISAEAADKPTGTLVANGQAATDYLIVTSAFLQQSAEALASYKNSIGISSAVEIIDNILGITSGRDDAERLREYLKDFYSNGGRYVLLLGDETQLPVRYAYPYSVSAPPTLDMLQICDLYFADMTGNWDVDNDGVWGEKYIDQPDITPELMVGRLPFNSPDEVYAYTDKLIKYETNPGNGNPSYLEKTFFFSSDQMRDGGDGGQHRQIALAYPDYFLVDTARGIELSRGDDPNPTNTGAEQLEDVLSEGWGIVNVVAHGRNDAFGVKTAYYNEWPKSYFMADAESSGHGDFNHLAPNQMTALYYSLACDNGGFDMDQPPFNQTLPNIVQTLLSLNEAGAVAFVANSRWGWVSSSYLYQKAFFESLFANPDCPAVQALYDAKAALPYYSDQVYGLNYFGDPTLKVYTGTPGLLSVATEYTEGCLVIDVEASQGNIRDCQVLVSQSGNIIFSGTTDDNGKAYFNSDLSIDEEYIVSALADGYAIGRRAFTPTLVTDVQDNQYLPDKFALAQNYPNPFNPTTTIQFELPVKSSVVLSIYNILGQNITTLIDRVLSAGSHTVVWDGANSDGDRVASGVYFYRLTTETNSDVRKMVLTK